MAPAKVSRWAAIDRNRVGAVRLQLLANSLTETGTLVSLKLETEGSESSGGSSAPFRDQMERSDSGRSSEGNGNDESFRLNWDEGKRGGNT